LRLKVITENAHVQQTVSRGEMIGVALLLPRMMMIMITTKRTDPIVHPVMMNVTPNTMSGVAVIETVEVTVHVMCLLNQSIEVAAATRKHIDPHAHIAIEARNIVSVIAPKIGIGMKMDMQTARRAQMEAPVASTEVTKGTSIATESASGPVSASDPVTEIVKGTVRIAKSATETTNMSVRETDGARGKKIGGVAVTEKQRKMSGILKTTNIAPHVVVVKTVNATRTRGVTNTNQSRERSCHVMRGKKILSAN